MRLSEVPKSLVKSASRLMRGGHGETRARRFQSVVREAQAVFARIVRHGNALAKFELLHRQTFAHLPLIHRAGDARAFALRRVDNDQAG